MRKLRKLIRRCKFSDESLYLYAGFKKRDSFKRELKFHDMKTAITSGLLILFSQVLIAILLGLF